MEQLQIVDYAILVVLVLGLINGFRKGIILQLAGLAAIILAILLTLKFHQIVADYLATTNWVPESALSLASLMLTFILSYFGVKWVSKIVDKTVRSLGLGIFNRLAGALFGFLINFVVVGVILYYLHPFLPEQITGAYISQQVHAYFLEFKSLVFSNV